MSKQYAAFISYSSRYREWVATLHRNLERCLAHHGETREVFFDQADLGTGQSWVAQLQAGVDRADQLVLVVTPEALASPWVAAEWEGFLSESWTGRLQLAMLVDTPLPPFLGRIHWADFSEHDEEKYRRALGHLLAGLLGHEDCSACGSNASGATTRRSSRTSSSRPSSRCSTRSTSSSSCAASRAAPPRTRRRPSTSNAR